MIRYPSIAKVRLNEAVGAAVRSRRKEHGMTTHAFAEALGVGQGHLTKLESGAQMFTIWQLYVATMVFDCTLDELVPVLEELEVA